MVTNNYYIEDIGNGTVLMNDGTWELYLEENDHEVFASQEDAYDHIQNLPEGIYRIFRRIVKS